MKNEMTNATANVTEITAQGKSQVAKYFKAIETAKKSAWSVAKVVYDTVNGANFEKNFGSRNNYAAAIKMSKGSVSMMARAYEMYITNPECLEGFTYTAVTALLAIPEGITVEEFVNLNQINVETPASEIKDAVKRYRAGLETTQETETESAEAETESTEAETESTETETETISGDVVETISIEAGVDVVYIGGKLWTLSPDDVATIKEVLGL